MSAMYKNRNTGTGNGMRGTRGMGTNVIFREMSLNLPGNVLKYSGECPSAALLLYVSSVATREIHLAPRGIEPGPSRCDFARRHNHYATVNWWAIQTH